ncbi:MAG: hypothetical protein P4M00_01200 [Azospirillaceae bacterium]|nr:hypothetical protein [Azospirillaceae bacterium]
MSNPALIAVAALLLLVVLLTSLATADPGAPLLSGHLAALEG